MDSGLSGVISTNSITQSAQDAFAAVEELRHLPWLAVDLLEPIVDQMETLPELPSPSAIALLQYTSGSTGTPKGVMVTHQNIVRNADFMRQNFSLSRNSISVTWLPTFHDNGLIDGVCVPVYVGYPVIILPPVAFIQKPFRWLKAICKYKATHSGGPNFAFDHCVDAISDEERQELNLSSLNTLYCGAEPIRKSTLDRFADAFSEQHLKSAMLYPSYGMAETTLIISGIEKGRGPVSICVSGNALEQHRVEAVADDAPDARYLVGVGRPWIDTKVHIVNPDGLTLCPDDEVGEVWVNGSIVTAGYWNNPELTESTYHAQLKTKPGVNYLRTGDLGFLHQGELYITGRLKDLLIFRGANYYPQDLEFIAEGSHPALRPNSSAAFSVEMEEQERLVIVAEVERVALREVNVKEVCDAIRQQISEELELSVYAVQLLRPASILKTSSGKIQRKGCKEAFLNQTLQVVCNSRLDQAQEVENTSPNTPDPISMQAWLMAWLHIQLKIPFEKIDNSKPLSVYGLNSMKALQLQQDVLDTYGVNMPPYLFFDNLSIKELITKAWEMINEG